MQPQHPAELRRDRAVGLVQLGLGARCAVSRGLERSVRPGQGGQRRRVEGEPRGGRDGCPARRGQLDRPLCGEHAAGPQFVTGCCHDGHRQFGQPGYLAHGGRLCRQHGRKDVADAGFALSEAHRGGDLSHHVVQVH